jgi:S-DNA-T family DNA segregation ATPase FtsK/SpoIIIE
MAEQPELKVPRPVPSPAVLEARLRGLADEVGELVEDGRRVGQAEHQRALTALRSVQNEEFISGEPDARSAVDRAVSDAVASIAPKTHDLADQLAPGLASMAPDGLGWRSHEFVGTGITSHVRLGVLDVAEVSSLPVVAPLLGANGWRVEADRGASAHRLLQSVALRLVATAEPFRLRVDAFHASPAKHVFVENYRNTQKAASA